MSDIQGLLVGAAITAVIGVLFRNALDEPIRRIVFHIPWLKWKRGSLSGFWFGCYDFDECGQKAKHSKVEKLYELIELRWPKGIVFVREVQKDRNIAVSVIKARKQDSYLTGTYENPSDHDRLHGVFQLWISPRGDVMEGKFIGYSAESPRYINHGDWFWKRYTLDRSNESREEAKREFRNLGQNVEHVRKIRRQR